MNYCSARNLRAALGLLTASSLPLFAVAQTAPAAASDKPEDKTVKLEKYVVTGSYIPSVETAVNAGFSPVVTIDRKAIEQSGYTTTAELLQRTTISNSGAVPISNNATGFTPSASSVSLRGLGPEATLVLINGRRVAPFPVGSGGTTAFVDLNSIPLSAIETIEVLKDGASALYGADAVAGVVNIKMRKGFDGTELNVSYGNTTDGLAGSDVSARVLTGATTETTSFVVGVNYFKKSDIANKDRDFSAVPPFLSSNSSPLNLEVGQLAVLAAGVPASALPAGRATFFANTGATSTNNGQVPANQIAFTAGRSSAFNFNEFSVSLPKSERLGAFVSGERRLFGSENIKGYVDISYQNVEAENALAPSATGNFTTAGQVELVIPANTANPILSYVLGGQAFQIAAGATPPTGAIPGSGTKFINGAAQRIAAPGAFNTNNPFNQDIAGGTRARFAEFGNRIFKNETDATMLSFGMKGDNIMEKWNFDANFTYSNIKDTTRNTLNSASKFNQILNGADPIFNPGSANFVGTTIPYNPFGFFRNPIPNNTLLVPFDQIVVKDVNESTLGQASFVASTGELLNLPAGPVGFAWGGDFRSETLEQNPDAFGFSGDLIGSSPNAITRGQRKIGGIFVEARIPILANLELNAAGRREEFVTSSRHATVPKVGLRYTPIADELTIRATYSEGFREPSLYELFSSPTSGLFPITDPRNGSFEPEQPFVVSGNRRLEPETTKYYNAGFVWSPKAPALKGFTVGLDFWKINRSNTVDSNPQDTLNRFFGVTPDGTPAPGGLVAGESVVLSPSGLIDTINSKFFNVGKTKAQGVDLSFGYTFATDTMGRFDFTTNWTYLDEFKQADVPGQPLVDLVGTDSTGTGDDGYLEWKGRINLDWTYKSLGVFVSAFYNDGFADIDADGNDFQVNSRLIFEAQINYNFRDRFGALLKDTKITVGARNLFDKDPPFASGFGGNSTGYPGFLYTAENRFVYVNLSRKF